MKCNVGGEEVVESSLAGAAIALMIGLLLGLERESVRRPSPDAAPRVELFAGIRTFPLFSLAGYVGAMGSAHGAPLALPAVLLVLGALAVTAYVRAPEHEAGVTTEAAAVVAALLGALVAWNMAPVAAALAVVTALLLTLKAPLHRLAGALSEEEILAILKFAVVAVILVPLLPARELGPYGALEPRRLGVVVLMLSGVSLAGYLLVRVVGGRAGWPLAGLMGGLVSSTAVTLSFSGKARESKDLVRALAVGIILASTVLYVRGGVVAMLLDREMGLHLLPRLGVLLAVALAAAALQFRHLKGGAADAAQLGNPVELGRAVTLTIVFAVVILAARFAQARLGTAGLWAVAAVGGLVDVDSVTVAAARLRQQGLADPAVAGGAFLLASLTNLAFKAGAVVLVGGRELARRVLPAFGAMAVATGALLVAWL
jgi:uncharacterized membrane protein (DUF4010 family)